MSKPHPAVCSVLLIGLFLLLPAGSARSEPRTVRIGLVADGPYYYGEECWERFKKEIAVFEGDEFQFSYPPEYQLVGDWELSAIRSNCEAALAADEVDVIVGMGLAVSSFFAAQTDLTKPVLLFGDLDCLF